MPLVLMCGYPASGKTSRANELKEYFLENCSNIKTVIVNDGEINKNAVYINSRKESSVRSALKSAADRELSTDTIVIVDSLNYIKGYRYELHCIAKYARTTYCVLHCDTSKENAKIFNDKRDEKYSDEIIDALVARFEAPNTSARWDSPLYTIQVDDVLPFENISQILLDSKPQKPNLSTQNPPLKSPTFMYEADKILQLIGGSILAAQKNNQIGDKISIPGFPETYTLQQSFTVASMRKHRKQFLVYLRANPVADIKDLPKTFLYFLSNAVS